MTRPEAPAVDPRIEHRIVGWGQIVPGVRYWHAIVKTPGGRPRWACSEPRPVVEMHRPALPTGDSVCDRCGCQKVAVAQSKGRAWVWL